MSAKEEFTLTFITNFNSNAVVKLVAASPVAPDGPYRKVTVVPAIIKRIKMLSVTSYTATQAFVTNYTATDFERYLINQVVGSFNNIILTTTSGVFNYNISKNGSEKLTFVPVSGALSAHASHNQVKQYPAPASLPFFYHLGISNKQGEVLPSRQHKFRQVNQFLNILQPQIQKLQLKNTFSAFDMGSGKGYLTFALYSLLQTSYSKLSVSGIEERHNLVNSCNSIAQQCGYTGLSFLSGSIAETVLPAKPTLVMALHACNTATDDALILSVKAETELIVVAPCCHKQVRTSMQLPAQSPLTPIFKYGIFKERQAEMATDAIRALVLQYYGYHVEVAEFVPEADTPKNIIILARRVSGQYQPQYLAQIAQLQQVLGITQHYLVKALNLQLPL